MLCMLQAIISEEVGPDLPVSMPLALQGLNMLVLAIWNVNLSIW